MAAFEAADFYQLDDLLTPEERRVRDSVRGPVPAIWTSHGPKYYADADINGGRTIWPIFDILPDGRRVISPIQIQETSLWAVDLTYTSK